MTRSSITTELKNMPPAELEREITAQKLLIAKLKAGVAVGKEKDTAKLRRERRQYARLLTVLRSATIPAPRV